MKNQQNPHIAWNDFALIVSGAADKAKSRLPLTKPVNLLTGAGGNRANSAAGNKAHVVILNANRQLYIRDLTGTAGLKVRNELVDGAELVHGDNVKLGKMEYEVFATERCVAPATAAPPVAVLYPSGSADPIYVRVPVTVLGTSDAADVRVGRNYATDVLAMIVSLGGRFWLWVLQPGEGAKIDGKPITRAELPDACTLSVGDDEFHFRIQNPTVAPTAPEHSVAAGVDVPPSPAPASMEADIDGDVQTLPVGNIEQFRQWGALAFAVASANQAELHDPTIALDPAKFGPSKPPSRWRVPITILMILAMIAAIAAGGIYVWTRWKHLST